MKLDVVLDNTWKSYYNVEQFILDNNKLEIIFINGRREYIDTNKIEQIGGMYK